VPAIAEAAGLAAAVDYLTALGMGNVAAHEESLTAHALDALREQGEIVRSTLLPQVELTYQSALASYQSGRVDFTTLLDAERQIRRTQLDLLKIELEQQVRLAEIERIVGDDL